MILGVLPTITNDLNVYTEFIKHMEAQTVKVDLLTIGYQGDDESFSLLKEKLLQGISSIKIEFLHINERSLARTKNILLDKYKVNFDYIFIYEDDVVYDEDYNERMIKELNGHNADMISAVEKNGITAKGVLRALLYTICHIYPLNDMRSLLMILPFGITIKTRYLSGGFSLVKREVFEDVKYDNKLLLYSLGEDVDFSFRVSSKYKTVLTNKIRCIHNSTKVRKFNPLLSINAKINFWSYFFNKNIHNKCCLPPYYILLLINLMEAAILSIKTNDFRMLHIICKTIRLNRKKIYTSPFIEGSLSYDSI